MPRIEPFEQHTEQYEKWFDDNPAAYRSELNAVRRVFPSSGEGVEIGVGTGRFAVPLGVEFGIEPSARMAAIARQKGILVVRATGEHVPLADAEFDVALMVTTLCFLDDIPKTFNEVHRILRDGGNFIIGFVDKNSPIGKQYELHKSESAFYSQATFYSIEEVLRLLKEAGFYDFVTVQTIFRPLSEMKDEDPVEPGHGRGSFLVVRGTK